MKTINVEEMWTKEWNNAYNFFNTKGNLQTKSRLKDKWKKEFIAILREVDCAWRENTS